MHDNGSYPQISLITQMTERHKQKDVRTYNIIGAAMEVHGELGCGFLEPVYHEALALEFEKRDIPFTSEIELPIFYKGRRLSTGYRVDFICYGAVIAEIKALKKITGTEKSQVINYLKAAGLRTGLLLNFGIRSLKFERVVLSSSA